MRENSSVEDQKSRSGRLRWGEWLLLLLGLAVMAAQAALASPLKSAAFDEEYHLAAGYAYLKTGDFRMSTSHPPLVDTLGALPLLLLDNITLPTDHPAWAASDYFIFSDVFLWQANENAQEMLVYGRYAIIALSVLLAAVLFVWARQMAGPAAGWMALALAVFEPNLIANGRLLTTDLGLTLFMTLTMWRLWVWLERPSSRNLVLAGILAGGTMAAKFTGVMVWPMIVGVMVIRRVETKEWRLRHSLHSLVSTLFFMALAAYVALWAIYRFDFGPIPGSNFPLPIPAPFYPFSLWDTFRVIEEQPKAAFLLGQVSDRGWWYYFPVALALKTSLPLLGLTAVGLFVAVKDKGWGKTAVLWLPPLSFMLLAMTGRITIGYRHILPVVPFLILLAAQVGKRWEIGDWKFWRTRSPRSPVSSLLLMLLFLWHISGSLRLWPHQEAYFNELAGGPENGSRWLVDSNIDWGQDLIFLHQLLLERGIGEVYLGYFGTALPEKYGIVYKPLPGFMRFTAGAEIDAYNPYTPPPGWYAISETSRRLGLMLQNTDVYAYFQDKEPVACAGYSICLYRVEYPAGTPVDRVVVADGRSLSDIPPEELGVQNGRLLIAKWVQPPGEIYPLGDGFERPIGFVPVAANFHGAFALVGYVLTGGEETAVSPGQSITLTLYWQVASGQIATPRPSQAAPLAAFVHLSGADPAQIVAQFDGWPTALTGLEPGDIIAQPVTLTVQETAVPGDYFVRVGLYSPQSGQRLPLVSPVGTGDAFLLTSVLIAPPIK
ncbi:MAG: glycosyltransferase family 39 protein [Chloroflexi bacterium]|nr:glycosyltransferase family 39 protein [Chloroflexota bacterium]MBP7041255.1 glycosyltransferase family 39 protein [Chloroflexota bacterium]